MLPERRVTRAAPACAAWGLAVLSLAGCAGTTGILPYGPGTFLVSEMRAPVLGGAYEAQRVALGEAAEFCARQGRVFAPVSMAPGGYPNGHYGPTDFTAVFQCREGKM